MGTSSSKLKRSTSVLTQTLRSEFDLNILPTNIKGKNAYYGYEYHIENITFPVSGNLVRAASVNEGNEISGESLTRFNGWPSELTNASLFPFLLPSQELRSFGYNYEQFGLFVKDCYQCSCAIIYCRPDGERVIIGSGNFTEDGVSTARHVYNNLSLDQLAVRFFKHDVRLIDDHKIFIRSDYIDLPVINRRNAGFALDAGYLNFAVIDAGLFQEYARILPAIKRLDYEPAYAETPLGQYALFHFAGGCPLVSIGMVQSVSLGSPIMTMIDIEGGPGASGSAAITKINQRVDGHAILVFRPRDAQNYDRAFVEYSKFFRQGSYRYEEAPYFIGSGINSIYDSRTLNVHGREFLQYSEAVHIHRRNGDKFPRPKDLEYLTNLPFLAANHHIIPIDDMVYLYEYFQDLDQEMHRGFVEEAKSLASSETQNKLRHARDGSGDAVGIKASEEKRMERKLKGLVQEKKLALYGDFCNLMTCLTPGNKKDKTWFAWSFWNLFQGPGPTQRTDDPQNNTNDDYSEQVKPLGFSDQLWSLLKNPQSGLYICLQNLKQSSRAGVRSAVVIACEKAIKTSLSNIHSFWNSPPVKGIYKYNRNDWVSSPVDGKFSLR